MTIPFTQLQTPSTSLQWLATLLGEAAAQGLPTTSWLSGDPLRTTYAILSVELNKDDAAISQQMQGGFLDYAATGTFTVTDIDGNTTTLPVSPDPSIPGQNPTGAATWLDLLVQSRYNILRTQATAAANPLWLVNTTGTSLGTFPPGTFHALNPSTQATFNNQASLTFSPSAVLGTSVSACTNTTPVTVTTSSGHGLTVSTNQVLGLTGLTIPNGVYQVFVTSSTQFTVTLPPGITPTGVYAGTAGRVYQAQSVEFQADLVGTAGNSAPYQINGFVTASPGGLMTNVLPFAGTPWQSNVSLAAQARAKLAALSSNGPSGAYKFYALAASLILSGEPVMANATNPSGVTLINPLPADIALDGGAITQATVTQSLTTGQVFVTLANATGPVGGCMNNAITNATAASPIQITSPAHGLVTGDYAQVNGVLGLAGANGVWQVTRVDVNNVTLNGSSGSGTYTSGSGQLSGGDLYAVNAVINAYATPDGVTEVTQSASSTTVTPTATVYVPKAFVGAYVASMTAAMGIYFAAFPIGGYAVDNATNVLPISAIEGILFAAGQSSGTIYTISVNGLQLNGGTSDINIGATGVAALGALTGITVVGV